MVSIAEEHMFIFGLLIFYGFLYICVLYGSEYLYGFDVNQVVFDEPIVETGNWIIDGIASMGQSIITFFTIMFVLPIQTTNTILIALNTAIFGTLIFLFIRVIRGS